MLLIISSFSRVLTWGDRFVFEMNALDIYILSQLSPFVNYFGYIIR